MTAMLAISRRRTVAVAAGLLAVASGVLSAGSASSAQQDVEPRVRDYEPRAREYGAQMREFSVRTESLDGAELYEETPEERTVIFDADVLFEFDSAELTADARSRLDRLAGDLDELGPRELTVSGHTDAEGADDYNKDLSERRAESVRSALEGQLGDDFTFDVTGYGETEPVADNDTEEGRALNRRVEVSFPTD